MRLTGSRGSVEAKVGDRFQWRGGGEWEIVEFRGDALYSPSVLWGTPVVRCKLVGGEPLPFDRKYMEGNEMDWCGDSVATALIQSGRAALSTGGE